MRTFFQVAVWTMLTALVSPSHGQAQDISAWPGMREIMEFKGLDVQQLQEDKMGHIQDAVLVSKGWKTTPSLDKPIFIDETVVLDGGVDNDFGIALLQNDIRPSVKPRAFRLSEGGFLMLVSVRQLEYYMTLYLKNNG